MHGMDVDDEINYWRERAKRAEQQLAAMTAERNEAKEMVDALKHDWDNLVAEFGKVQGQRDAASEDARLARLSVEYLDEACEIGLVLVAAAERDGDMSDEEVEGYRARGRERLNEIRQGARAPSATKEDITP